MAAALKVHIDDVPCRMQEPKSPKLQQMAALAIARIAAKGLQSKYGWQQSLAYRLLTACLDAYIPASGGHSSLSLGVHQPLRGRRWATYVPAQHDVPP